MMTSPLLPVVMTDGGESAHVGSVLLNPSGGGKKLLFAVSGQVGVSPCQLNSFLVRVDRGFRVRITEKTDLGMVVREGGDWYVLAVVSRSRNSSGRNRRSGGRRSVRGISTANGFATAAAGDVNLSPMPQSEKIILRRNQITQKNPAVHARQHVMPEPAAEMRVNAGMGLHVLDQYNRARMIWNLERDRQRFIETMMWTPASGEVKVWRRPEVTREAACGVCETAAGRGIPAGFHRCVKDEVVEFGPFFRSPIGPIQRPISGRDC